MVYKFEHVKIDSVIGITGKKQLNLHEYAKSHNLDLNLLGRLQRSLGFESVRVIDKPLTVSDLCVAGAKNIISHSSISFSDVDAIIFVSQTPDQLVPGTTYGMQPQLELRKDVLTMDLVQGCSGWLYGLFYASTLIESKICSNVLVCNGDLCFYDDLPVLTDDDIGKLSLGDGAAVTFLSYSDKKHESFYEIKSNGEKKDVIVNPSSGCRAFRQIKSPDQTIDGLIMDGLSYAEYVMETAPIELKKLLQASGYCYDDFSCLLMHQSNKSLLNAIEKMLGLPPNFVPFLAKNTGNTSSASIPLVFSENSERFASITRDKKTLLCSVGVGLSAVTCILDFSNTYFHNCLYL